jgi:hypothetical protein
MKTNNNNNKIQMMKISIEDFHSGIKGGVQDISDEYCFCLFVRDRVLLCRLGTHDPHASAYQVLGLQFVPPYQANEYSCFKTTDILKIIWAGRVAQVVEHLPNNCEAPSLNPCTAPTKHFFPQNTEMLKNMMEKYITVIVSTTCKSFLYLVFNLIQQTFTESTEHQ